MQIGALGRSVLLAVVGGLVSPIASQAELCVIDAVPAATLLLPYFEVELASRKGIDTVFSVNNASEKATVAQATVWSDWGMPIISFPIPLAPFQAQSVSLRILLEALHLRG